MFKFISKVAKSVLLVNKNDNGEVLNLANISIVSFSKRFHLNNLRSKNAGNMVNFCELTNFINNFIRNNKLPDSLKQCFVIPVHKKLSPSDKANYRTLSVLMF